MTLYIRYFIIVTTTHSQSLSSVVRGMSTSGPPDHHRRLLSARPAIHNNNIIISRDRTKQIAEHVRCAHNASDSQRNGNTSPSQTHPRELHCGVDPISNPSTAHRRVVRAFVIVHP